MGYLGKISALVTVNTGDFAPKLNAAAKDVRTFAKTVESTIGSSMRSAAKSLADIYTPLQKFERALQAATTAKLSFAGFAGAIKDVDMLQQRLTSLSGRQVDVVLKASGMKDITTFRNAIFGLTSQQFNLMLKVGGVERLEEIRRLIASGDQEFAVVAQTQQAMERVQSLRKELDSARVAAVDVTVAVDTSSVDAAREKVRQATQELMTYAAKATGGDITDPKQLREAALSQRVDAENKVSRLEAGKAKPGVVEEAKKEVAELTTVIRQLSALQKQKKQAERELMSAERAANPSTGIKAIERELKSAEKSYKELIQVAQQKIVAKFGVQVDLGDMESLLDGAAPEAARKLQASFEAAGMSASDAAARVRTVMDELGRSDLTASADRLRQMMSVTEEIAKPLGAAKDSLLKMSGAIQAEFLPVLGLAQDGVESLKAAIAKDEGESAVERLKAAYAELKRNVDANIDSIKRLDEASGKLNRIPTGRELAFAAPQVASTLDRSVAIGASAAALPASAIQSSPQIVESLMKINELSTKAAAAYARLESATSGGLPLEVSAARENLRTVLRTLLSTQEAAEKQIKVEVDAVAAQKKADELKQTLKAVGEGVEFTITGRIQNFDQAKQELARVTAAIEQLSVANRSAFGGRLRTLNELVAVGDVARLVEVRRLLDEITDSASDARFVEVDTAAAKKKADDLKASLNAFKETIKFTITGQVQNFGQARQELERLIAAVERLDAAKRAAFGDRLNSLAEVVSSGNATRLPEASELIGQLDADVGRASAADKPPPSPTQSSLDLDLASPLRQFNRLESSIVGVKSQLDTLPAPIRDQFLPGIRAAEQAFIRLKANPRATAEEIERMALGMQTLEAAARRAVTADRVRQAGSGGSAERLNLNIQERSLTGYQAQLQLLQQTLGRVSVQARGPAVASFIALENAIATAFQNGTLDSASTQRQVARLTQEAVRATAAVAGIRAGGLARQLARVGDVARGAFGNVGLAVQQGIFAFDDFFSVTGDLSQRIRAAGNNISQLGFILGGTYGLLAGVAISAGTQLAIGFGKFIGVLEDTGKKEAEAKAQAEVLGSAYERQREIVRSLADAYRDLSRSIRESTETPQNKAFNDRRGQIADLRQQQQDAARERVAQAVPQIFNNRRQRALLEGQLQEQPDFAEQRRIRRQIGRLQAEEDAAFNVINENAGRLANQPRGELVRQRDELAILRDNLVRDAARLPAGGQAQQNVNARLDEVSNQLAAFNVAIQRVTDDAVAAAIQLSGPLQDNIQKAQQRLAEAFGDTQTRAQVQLEQLGIRLAEANEAAAGGGDRRGARQRIDAIRLEAAPLLSAQQELIDFAETLKAAAEAARQAEQQARSQLEDAAASVRELPGSEAAQGRQQAAAQNLAETVRRRQEIEAATQGGRNAVVVGDAGEILRRRQVLGDLTGGLDEFQRDAERQRERRQRGFELTAGETGVFQEKLQADLRAVEDRARANPPDAQRLIQEGRASLSKESAPLFAELAANVQNAILRGPSRAALNVSDATSVEGSRELNRLLRGDDPAKDVNLVELQKQTANLTSIDKGIKDLVTKIGVAQ